MARSIRIQIAGGLYHVMARGNRRERIFADNDDRRFFLGTLAEACGMTASLLRGATTVSQRWIAGRLEMGNAANVSQQIRRAKCSGGIGKLPHALKTFSSLSRYDS